LHIDRLWRFGFSFNYSKKILSIIIAH
jgi:hypothetical protein